MPFTQLHRSIARRGKPDLERMRGPPGLAAMLQWQRMRNMLLLIDKRRIGGSHFGGP
jgi:hypothetical protein